MKRLFALLLCLVMCVSALPLQAFAEDITAQEAVISDSGTNETLTAVSAPISDSGVNPIYEGIISAGQIGKTTRNITTATSVNGNEYVSESKAIAKIRANLVARKTEFTVYIETKYLDSSKIQSKVNSIFSKAFEHTGKPKEGDYLNFQWGTYYWDFVNNEYYNNAACTKVYLPVVFKMAYYTSASNETWVDGQISSIIKSLNLSGHTDFEKAELIYRYIVNHVTYDYSHVDDRSYWTQFTAYAALKGKSVCQGYALLFYRLALEAGLSPRIVASKEIDHSWNIIEMGNGKYYYLDATWDENSGNRKYSDYIFFMKGTDYWTSEHDKNLGNVWNGLFSETASNKKYSIPSSDLVQSNPSVSKIVNTKSGIKITWTKQAYANKYDVYRSVDGGKFTKVKTTSSTGYTDKDVKAGKTYSYKVLAKNTNLDITSKQSSAKKYVRLQTPTGAKVQKVKKGIQIKWKAVTGANKYWIYRSVNGGAFKKVKATKSLSWVSPAKSGKTYRFRIYAVKSSGGTDYKSAYAQTKKLKR